MILKKNGNLSIQQKFGKWVLSRSQTFTLPPLSFHVPQHHVYFLACSSTFIRSSIAFFTFQSCFVSISWKVHSNHMKVSIGEKWNPFLLLCVNKEHESRAPKKYSSLTVQSNIAYSIKHGGGPVMLWDCFRMI